jgi:glycine/D-amino acid oxidase-like deaminating enzyme
MNSALFVEELAGYLLRTYPSRFQVFERTPAGRIQLQSEHAEIRVGERRILARDLVLCTNGFEHLDLRADDESGLESRFHRNISGVTGFMSGYLEPMDRGPAAISYLDERFKDDRDYVYLTRRPYEREARMHHNLVCIGGPVKGLGESTDFPERFPFPAEAQADIDAFWTYHRPRTTPPVPAYRWHGLMGYTPTGVRLVGRDPKHPRLLYNLGCNGIGILPSIMGGARIADILAGKRLTPSIFDPDIQEDVLRRHANEKRP